MPVFYENTPLGSLTVGDLKHLVEEFISTAASSLHKEEKTATSANLVYGLRGIQELFGCSHKTAQAYKDGFLKSAVRQNGRKIVVDRDLALELFAAHEEGGKK